MSRIQYPPGSFNIHWFQLFNAVAFQIMMGAPIILYAKSIGASSTVLGIIASFTPLMTVFQLPAAHLLAKYGYKPFVLMGWGARTVFIFIVALVPVMWFLDNLSKMALMLAALFLFNLLRGISSGAWAPWITAIIPQEHRGRFLSTDSIFIHGGCLLALIASAFVMSGQVDPWEYTLVFLISAIGQTISLFCLRAIPTVESEAEVVQRSGQRVPWRQIIAYPPFFRLLLFNVFFTAVIGSLAVFTVEFLKEYPKFDVSFILFLSAISFVSAIMVLPIVGMFIDRVGSKPFLALALVLFGVVIAGWFLTAANVIPTTIGLIAGLNFLSGVAGANFNLANTRIAMATMPEMGRNHFFALFTVITSLGMGSAPVFWGVALDIIGTYEAVAGWFVWRRHSIYFAILFLLNLVTLFLVFRLYEVRGGANTPVAIYAALKRQGRTWLR